MYNVVILAEQPMTTGDASEVVSLHEAIEDERHYHVLIPCDNAAMRVETALGSLSASEVMSAPPMTYDDIDVTQVQEEIDETAETAVATSVEHIEACGVGASGEFSSDDPIDRLLEVVKEHDADEVIVMTRPHVVAEFLHRDWASKARRKLGVPLLHLVEHEPLDAEAGDGQGITGM